MAEAPLVTQLPPRLAAALGDARPPFYLHRTEPWVWRILMLVGLLASAAALAFAVARAVHPGLDAAGWMLGLFALPFFVLLLRRSAWDPPVAMVADARGLHFLHGPAGSQCHFVAWRDVGAMRIERFAGGAGLARTVVVGIRGDSPFWAPTMDSRLMRHLVQPVAADGYRRLPLSPQWTNPQATLEALERLRADSVD